MITDSDGNELVYWPISGLIEGENSEVLSFTVAVPTEEASITATYDARINVWVKKVGDASYVNISTNPYDLAGLSGDVDFLVYIEALSPIEGLERIPISIVVGSGSSAGWAD